MLLATSEKVAREAHWVVRLHGDFWIRYSSGKKKCHRRTKPSVAQATSEQTVHCSGTFKLDCVSKDFIEAQPYRQVGYHARLQLLQL